jgi:hypothetical protein
LRLNISGLDNHVKAVGYSSESLRHKPACVEALEEPEARVQRARRLAEKVGSGGKSVDQEALVTCMITMETGRLASEVVKFS